MLARFVVWLLIVCAPAGALAIEVIVGLPYGKKHPIGHTSVRVHDHDEGEDVIFDFGRYGDTWGYLNFQGEGVMRVWRGPKAIERFLEKQTSYRDSVGFVIEMTEEEERKVLQYYEKLLASAKWEKDYSHDHHTRYRLAEDYNGVTIQCTSVALHGWRHAWPRERWEAILHPRFNKGRGFRDEQRAYYFEKQKELGVDEVVVPLDLLAALKTAKQKGHPNLGAVRKYPKR